MLAGYMAIANLINPKIFVFDHYIGHKHFVLFHTFVILLFIYDDAKIHFFSLVLVLVNIN